MPDQADQPTEPATPGQPVNPDPAVHPDGRPMSFMERARLAAAQAAKIGSEVGREAAKVGAEVGKQVEVSVRDPANQAKARSALNKAKRGFSTALERIDPKILADVVIKATSLQERANASLKDRGSVYRIGEIGIGASIPPSITFTIERVDDPNAPGLADSSTLLGEIEAGAGATEAIVTLDGTAIDDDAIEEAAKEA
jgi:hypothetical protein